MYLESTNLIEFPEISVFYA